MKDSKSKFDVFYNVIVNWGTYSKEEYLEKNVTNPNHKGHEEFLQVLNEMKDLPFFTNNFNHLYKNTKFDIMKKIFNVRYKEGHLWLINERLKEGKNVCLASRDVEPNDNQTLERKSKLKSNS